MDKIALKLNNVQKKYGSFAAVQDFSLIVNRGEFISLLGPSGCGKTTVLRLIAGYLKPDAGTVLIEHEDMTHVPPYRRDIGMVFQSYALFPHMTVEQNVAFGLQRRGVQKDEIKTRVMAALELVRLEGVAGRRPKELSGGQQQRVALARVIVIQPRLLLLDEPLSNLDAKLRRNMQVEIRRLQESLHITTVHVTHDQSEALSLSDRIVVMNQGKIEQIGTPEDIYVHPYNSFVADFIGESNLLEGYITQLEGGDGTITIRLTGGEGIRVIGTCHASIGTRIGIVIRPEAIQVFTYVEHAEKDNSFPAILSRVIYSGPITTILLELKSGQELKANIYSDGRNLRVFKSGQEVIVRLPPDSLLIVQGREN